MLQHPNAGEYELEKFIYAYDNTMFKQDSSIVLVDNKGKPSEDFLKKNIELWNASEKREWIRISKKYYENENDILERKRTYVGNDGVEKEVPLASNTKLNHPTHRKLNKQKVNYLLSKPFTIKSDDDRFNKFIETIITKRFRQKIKRLGTEACNSGIAWVQVYFNKQSELDFKLISTEEVIPFWEDGEHTKLGAVIRTYKVSNIKADGSIEDIDKIEWHTQEGVWYFKREKDKLVPDDNREAKAYGYFKLQIKDFDEDGNPILRTQDGAWDTIPFIPFKYNAEEIPLIKWTKNLIDDYDFITSDTSNIIKDNPNAVKVVRNYDGEDLGEFNRNMAVYRAVKVSDDGDVTALETKTDIKTIEAHLQRLKDDIFISADAVDHNKDDLGQATGVALKFKYAGLDSDTDDMASEFSSSLEQLLSFYLLDHRNKTGEDLSNVKYEIIFNTDTIVNETEIINNVKTSMGVVSDKTALSQHPWVTDVDSELNAVDEDRKKHLQENVEEMKALTSASGDGFGNGENNNGQNVANQIKEKQAKDKKGEV